MTRASPWVGVTIGGNEMVVMAGPCSVEGEEQLLSTARMAKEAGARILRGGAFKPRSSPYSFRGMGVDGLKLLAEARAETGLPVVTEVMTAEDVEVVAEYADILQVGARNVQNFILLDEVGKLRKPVLLKRGFATTYEELLLSAEYIMAGGNQEVILCERGIRTFEDYTRNTLDLTAIPVIKRLSHLPIIADPSHGTGPLAPGAADGAGGGGRGLPRAHDRGAPQPGQGAVGRSAVADLRELPKPHERHSRRRRSGGPRSGAACGGERRGLTGAIRIGVDPPHSGVLGFANYAGEPPPTPHRARMTVLDELARLHSDNPTVVTVGMFDGVHRGHQYLVGRLKETAARMGCASAIITFTNHPRTVMRPDRPHPVVEHPRGQAAAS